jgi:hypothetical protein
MDRLLSCDVILLYGCGGGFDIYAGVPLYLELLKKNKTVYLMNCSFTDDLYKYSVDDKCIVQINGTECLTRKNEVYFPEYTLASFLKTPVYAVRLVDHISIAKELTDFVIKNKVSCIIVIDAGHDAILFGDEKQCGSPIEDVTTVLSVNSVVNNVISEFNIITYVACISAPTEHMDFDLFLDHFKLFENAFIHQANNDASFINTFSELLDRTSLDLRSVPNECLLAAMRGLFGVNFVNPRLKQRALRDSFSVADYPTIRPETSLYYFIELSDLIRKSPFYTKLLQISNKPISNHEIYALLHK